MSKKVNDENREMITFLESMAEYCRIGMKEVSTSYAENMLRFELEDILKMIEAYKQKGGE